MRVEGEWPFGDSWNVDWLVWSCGNFYFTELS
jgi:hypothetical protein